MLNEILRRPALIAAVAAVVLVSNLITMAVVSNDDGQALDGIEDGRDPLADGSDAPAGNGGGDDSNGAGDAPSDGSTDASGDPDGSGSEGGTDGPGGTDGTDGTDGDPGTETGSDAPSDDPDATEAPAPAELRSPEVGTYIYDASGTWQNEGDVLNELPARAEGTVSAAGTGRWGFTVVAGPRYSDSYQFSLDDQGLDWTAWSLTRTFSNGQGGEAQGTTTYTCGSTDAFFIANNESGRNIEHGCTGPVGLRSVGPVISQGLKTLDLADGTEATTVHLVYDYTVSSESVEGEGTLELWMDPTTGLRVQEIRRITSTSTLSDGSTSTYEENIRLTLRSLTPS